MRCMVYGLRQRGESNERALDRLSGKWLRWSLHNHDGDYFMLTPYAMCIACALLLMSESTGALGAVLIMLLRTLVHTTMSIPPAGRAWGVGVTWSVTHVTE